MSELINDKEIVDFTEIQLREVFIKAGLNSQDIDRAVADYSRYRESELSSLSILSFTDLQNLGAEALYNEVKKLRSGVNILKDILTHYLKYINYKKQIAETYQKSKDWATVFSTDVYSDIIEAQESFIDYVEETYQTKIKDAKHLQKLIGITHLDSWDEKTRKYITPDTEDEAKENAIRELDETLTRARYSKFNRALDKALDEGAKYKDLLKIKPQNYGLPETWSGCLGSDQYSSILWAIEDSFLIGEPNSSVRPDLKAIAQEIEAPYSVLMDVNKICNKWKLQR